MTDEKKNELNVEEVRELISKVGPSLGCGDFTYDPIFPEGRKDVCVVSHMAEDGHSYGFDTLYLVWKEGPGRMKYKEIKNTRSTKDYIMIKEIVINNDGSVTVDFGSGGSYSGSPWSESKRIEFSQK